MTVAQERILLVHIRENAAMERTQHRGMAGIYFAQAR